MFELLGFIGYVVYLYTYVIFAYVILGWLLAFGVLNRSNEFVRALAQALAAVTEPFLRLIRRVMPDTRPLDLSPIILFLICIFIMMVAIPNLQKLFVATPAPL